MSGSERPSVAGATPDADASRRSIRSVTVVLTSQCNLRCGYCFQNDKKPGRMDRETLRRSIDLLLDSRAHDLELQFYGGEPFLEQESLRWAVEYAEARRREDQRIQYFVTTNGTLVDDEALGFLNQHSVRLQLSFDGIPEVQRQRAQGSFERLDRLLSVAKERYPAWFVSRLRVAMTLTPLAIDRFAESVGYFFQKDVREIEVAPAITPVPRWQEDWREALSTQLERILELSVEHQHRFGRVPFLPFRARSSTEGPPPADLAMCGVDGTSDVAVDVDGDVHGCVMFAGSFQHRPSKQVAESFDRMQIGVLSQNPQDLDAGLERYPEQVRRAGYFHDKRRKHSPYARCAECTFLSRCSVCPVSIGNLPGNDDPHRIPAFLCAWNMASLDAQ
ncbi:MAG: radical SAM protein, partial [Candidatus Eisenbacteria bacterium]|nr:radical SAM protein [Candidatus Eisenbacteria bacterium]